MPLKIMLFGLSADEFLDKKSPFHVIEMGCRCGLK
jgi:hypothetical protein